MASRRAHLLCVLKRHHTYGVNTFVCSYSLIPNPSHSLVLSSLLDWQPYLLCGFPGFRGSSRETHSRSQAARPFFRDSSRDALPIFYQYFTLTQMRPRVPCYLLGSIEDKANSSRFGSSAFALSPLPPLLLLLLLLLLRL